MTSAELQSFNADMIRIAPELDSVYGRYPIRFKNWLDPSSSTDKGEPCFIASPDIGVKQNYVYGRGPLGNGYYHLLTKPAYVNLYGRLQSSAPSPGCCCFGGNDYQTYQGVKDVMYNRYVGSIPDDVQAKKDALSKAKDTAQVWYQGTQNEQLAIGAVQTGVNLSI